jgi:hypothetical protein
MFSGALVLDETEIAGFHDFGTRLDERPSGVLNKYS